MNNTVVKQILVVDKSLVLLSLSLVVCVVVNTIESLNKSLVFWIQSASLLVEWLSLDEELLELLSVILVCWSLVAILLSQELVAVTDTSVGCTEVVLSVDRLLVVRDSLLLLLV